jgi:hypothetical protein
LGSLDTMTGSGLEPAAARGAAGTGHDQFAVIEPGSGPVLISGAAVHIDMCYYEGNAICSKLAINKGQRRRIRAICAVDAPDCIAADRELIGVRLTLVRPPAAAVVVGVLGGSRVG